MACVLGRFVTYIVQFEVEAACVAHRVPVGVSPPQRRRGRLAVRARRARAPGCRLRHERKKESGSRDRITTQLP